MRFGPAGFFSRADDLSPRERRAVFIGLGTLLALLIVDCASAVGGIGGRGLAHLLGEWSASAGTIVTAGLVTLRARRIPLMRGPWSTFAVGLVLYAIGNVMWSTHSFGARSPSAPAVSNVLWLAFYPLAYIGIVRFARAERRGQPTAGAFLDGLIAGAGFTAIAAVVFYRHFSAVARGGPLVIATALTAPVCDLLLVALIVSVMALRGWRLNRVWVCVGVSFLVMAIADVLYAFQIGPHGWGRPMPVTNLIHLLAISLLGFGAWQKRPRMLTDLPRLGVSVLLIPGGFSIASIALLERDHFHRLDPVAFGFAIVCVAATITRMVLAFRDVEHLSEARHQAFTDSLTALPNRRAFMRGIERTIADVVETGGRISVMTLDLDHFKELNDTLGHSAGDALLRLVGPRLRTVLRAEETVARLGGDEFAILLDPSPDEAGIAGVAERIVAALRKPFEVQGISLRMTGSVGIATYPDHAEDAEGLMKRADVAMYQAKESRSGYDFYARERDTHSPARLALTGELADAIEHRGIEVHFQPKGDVRSRHVCGMEALVRWRRLDGRLVPPADFVAAAEHAGLSRMLTRRVTELALDQLSAWRARGYGLHVAVNTTVADLLDESFPDEVAAALQRRGLPPGALVLELTESSVLSDPVRIGSVLARLHALGVGLSLDDFGTGYSSLAHLKSLPVGEVKIDQSFVARMCHDDTDAAIVAAIAQLASRLDIRIVAEGVEDEDTWEALAGIGCDLIQGYLLSRPLPAAELDELLGRAADPAAAAEVGAASGARRADITISAARR